MCVSAEASFGLAGLLLPVGVYCMAVSGQRDRSFLPLSAIPLGFGIQQFCEGLVWVGIGRENAELTRSAALAYLFFAIAFWLFWVPFSAMILDPSRKIKRWLLIVTVLGLAGGLTFYLPLLLHPEILTVRVVQHSIHYDFSQSPALDVIPQLVWHLCYLAVVSLPLFLVAPKRQSLLGFSVALTVSAAISHAYFWYAFASVWCFFAAILSLALVYTFHSLPIPDPVVGHA